MKCFLQMLFCLLLDLITNSEGFVSHFHRIPAGQRGDTSHTESLASRTVNLTLKPANSMP